MRFTSSPYSGSAADLHLYRVATEAMFIAFFFVMVFVLMSGLFTSIDSMPPWAQVISRLNPVTYFIEVMRMVVLKGSGLRHISHHIGAVVLFALVFNTWAALQEDFLKLLFIVSDILSRTLFHHRHFCH
jgi:ABC-type polysaccharide/polyol phosphate export permease